MNKNEKTKTMDYEGFKEAIKEKFKDYLPEKYQDIIISFHQFYKVNRLVEELLISQNDKDAAPAFELETFYQKYSESGDFDHIMKILASVYLETMDSEYLKPEDYLDYSKLNTNTILEVVNTDMNRKMLESVPHIDFHDLSVIFRWFIKDNASTVVSNAMLETLNLSVDELYEIALKNTRRLFPAFIKGLSEAVMEIQNENEMPDEEYQSQEMNCNKDVLVISNKGFGASVILMEDVLKEISVRVGGSYYILPSSIYELIAVPKGFIDERYMIKAVRDINRSVVLPEEVLSNNIYYYDIDSEKVTMIKEAS